jgi:hypothetical protein
MKEAVAIRAKTFSATIRRVNVMWTRMVGNQRVDVLQIVLKHCHLFVLAMAKR